MLFGEGDDNPKMPSLEMLQKLRKSIDIEPTIKRFIDYRTVVDIKTAELYMKDKSALGDICNNRGRRPHDIHDKDSDQNDGERRHSEEALCSLYLVEREINDPLRRSAAAEAIMSRYSDMKSCLNGDVSKRTSAEGYEILCPDTLEDAKTIYVDVKVSVLDVIGGEDEQEKMTETLKLLGPWKSKKDIKFLTREEDRATVDMNPCYERYYEATPVDNVLAKFLSFTPDVHYFDNNMSKRFDREESVAVFGDLFKTLTEMIPLKASSSSQQPANKRLKTCHETETYTVKNGYSSCGKSKKEYWKAIAADTDAIETLTEDEATIQKELDVATEQCCRATYSKVFSDLKNNTDANKLMSKVPVETMRIDVSDENEQDAGVTKIKTSEMYYVDKENPDWDVFLLDRLDVLYAAIASEGKDDATNDLIQLNKFEDLVTSVFCPRITQILIENLNLRAINAVFAFSEIVKYVEKLNTVNGKLPGNEFRNLSTVFGKHGRLYAGNVQDIREFINKRQFKNIIDYVNETASDANASENIKDYIISALIDTLNGTDDLINSFFNQPSLEEKETEGNAFCPVILPKLNDFAVAVTGQAVMLIQAFIRVTSAGESEGKIKKEEGVGEKKRNNEVGGGDYPSIFARRLATAISEDFLKKTDMNTSFLSQVVVDLRKTAEAGLVKEISDRTSDIVKSQIANVVITTVLTARRLQYMDERRVEMMIANNEEIPVALLNAVN
ncbi:hypothetical protein O3P69_006446 [Scylla paramamosain]|uniref:Uncharacterized protein n=1 Tax=Scylla paramamosain TaxID=85552 RepID=A0AAW0U2N9_SCYPA